MEKSDPKSYDNSRLIAVVLVLVVLSGYLWYVYSGGTPLDFGIAESIESLGGPPPMVTMVEYSTVQNGMDYPNVIRIIGAPGVELSSNDIAGYRTVMYDWRNDDGSGMNAMFQNGKLIQKAQFGLK